MWRCCSASAVIDTSTHGPAWRKSSPRSLRLQQVELEVTARWNETLCDAAWTGDLDGVKAAIRMGANVNAFQKEGGWFPLYLASQSGHLEVVRFLLRNRAKVHQELASTSGSTALHVASGAGHLDVVKCLVEEGKAGLDSTNKLGRTPLMHAILKGWADVVVYLLKTHEQLSTQEKEPKKYKLEVTSPEDNDTMASGDTLSLASRSTALSNINTSTVNEITSVSTPETGGTALHFACQVGMLNVVQALVEQGQAPLSVTNKFGWTPLMQASHCGNHEIVRYLIEKDASTKIVHNITHAAGGTALHLACAQGHLKVVRILIDKGKAVADATNKMGWTPLMYATHEGHEDVARYLNLHLSAKQINARSKIENTTVLEDEDEDEKNHISILQRSIASGGISLFSGCMEAAIEDDNDSDIVERGKSPLDHTHEATPQGPMVESVIQKARVPIDVFPSPGNASLLCFLPPTAAADPADISDKLGQETAMNKLNFSGASMPQTPSTEPDPVVERDVQETNDMILSTVISHDAETEENVEEVALVTKELSFENLILDLPMIRTKRESASFACLPRRSIVNNFDMLEDGLATSNYECAQDETDAALDIGTMDTIPPLPLDGMPAFSLNKIQTISLDILPPPMRQSLNCLALQSAESGSVEESMNQDRDLTVGNVSAEECNNSIVEAEAATEKRHDPFSLDKVPSLALDIIPSPVRQNLLCWAPQVGDDSSEESKNRDFSVDWDDYDLAYISKKSAHNHEAVAERKNPLQHIMNIADAVLTSASRLAVGDSVTEVKRDVSGKEDENKDESPTVEPRADEESSGRSPTTGAPSTKRTDEVIIEFVNVVKNGKVANEQVVFEQPFATDGPPASLAEEATTDSEELSKRSEERIMSAHADEHVHEPVKRDNYKATDFIAANENQLQSADLQIVENSVQDGADCKLHMDDSNEIDSKGEERLQTLDLTITGFPSDAQAITIDDLPDMTHTQAQDASGAAVVTMTGEPEAVLAAVASVDIRMLDESNEDFILTITGTVTGSNEGEKVLDTFTKNYLVGKTTGHIDRALLQENKTSLERHGAAGVTYVEPNLDDWHEKSDIDAANQLGYIEAVKASDERVMTHESHGSTDCEQSLEDSQEPPMSDVSKDVEEVERLDGKMKDVQESQSVPIKGSGEPQDMVSAEVNYDLLAEVQVAPTKLFESESSESTRISVDDEIQMVETEESVRIVEKDDGAGVMGNKESNVAEKVSVYETLSTSGNENPELKCDVIDELRGSEKVPRMVDYFEKMATGEEIPSSLPCDIPNEVIVSDSSYASVTTIGISSSNEQDEDEAGLRDKSNQGKQNLIKTVNNEDSAITETKKALIEVQNKLDRCGADGTPGMSINNEELITEVNLTIKRVFEVANGNGIQPDAVDNKKTSLLEESRIFLQMNGIMEDENSEKSVNEAGDEMLTGRLEGKNFLNEEANQESTMEKVVEESGMIEQVEDDSPATVINIECEIEKEETSQSTSGIVQEIWGESKATEEVKDKQLAEYEVIHTETQMKKELRRRIIFAGL